MNGLTPQTPMEWVWLCVGLIGQALFFGRFVVQWIATEKARRSVIPRAFWYLSLAGGLVILAYALHKRDIVFILGQAPGVMIYSRNLYFINRERASAASTPEAATA